MQNDKTKRIILTGMPGSGKTTLITELSSLGYPVIHEAATDIISQAQSQGKPTPWLDPKFIINITDLQKQRQLTALENQTYFFDRSPICTYALCQFLNYAEPAQLTAELDRIQEQNIYHNTVYFIENLGNVENTPARQINYQDALAFEQLHIEAYQQFGYQLHYIPKAPISERLDRLINALKP